MEPHRTPLPRSDHPLGRVIGSCGRFLSHRPKTNLNPKIVMSKLFENKVVLVTGGTSGIGRATAIAFAREGAKVVVSGRRKAEGAETVTLVEKAGGRGLFVKADVSDEAQVKSLVDAVVEEFGRLDIAFNNAGVEGTLAPLTEATAEIYQQVFDI